MLSSISSSSGSSYNKNTEHLGSEMEPCFLILETFNSILRNSPDKMSTVNRPKLPILNVPTLLREVKRIGRLLTTCDKTCWHFTTANFMLDLWCSRNSHWTN